MSLDSSTKNYIPPRENIIENIYNNISNYFTPFFIKFKFSPNLVTIISGLLGLMGSYFLIIDFPNSNIFSFILINLFVVLDLVDGDLARHYNETSLFGRWLDLFFDKSVEVLFIFSLTLSCYRINMDLLTIFLGFTLLSAHLIYQYVMIANLYWFDNSKSDDKQLSKKTNIHNNKPSFMKMVLKGIMLHLTLKHSTLFFVGSLFVLFNLRYEGLLVLSFIAIYSLLISILWNFIRFRNQ